jgi:hypothetical protein
MAEIDEMTALKELGVALLFAQQSTKATTKTYRPRWQMSWELVTDQPEYPQI